MHFNDTDFSDLGFKGCPAQGEIKGSSGSITSPEFPKNYPNKASCRWRISVPPRHRLIFTFTAFSLESVANCESEYVIIRNSDDAGVVLDTVMNKRCGSRLYSNTVAARGRSAYLSFVSDDSQSFQGFNVTYYAKEQDARKSY